MGDSMNVKRMKNEEALKITREFGHVDSVGIEMILWVESNTALTVEARYELLRKIAKAEMEG